MILKTVPQALQTKWQIQVLPIFLIGPIFLVSLWFCCFSLETPIVSHFFFFWIWWLKSYCRWMKQDYWFQCLQSVLLFSMCAIVCYFPRSQQWVWIHAQLQSNIIFKFSFHLFQHVYGSLFISIEFRLLQSNTILQNYSSLYNHCNIFNLIGIFHHVYHIYPYKFRSIYKYMYANID